MFDEDSALLRKQQRFQHEIETTIRDANRKVIHDRIPDLNRQRIVAFATFVAQQRAEYLAAALNMQGQSGHPPEADLDLLRLKRRAYVEARDAFAALERAVERGYVDVN